VHLVDKPAKIENPAPSIKANALPNTHLPPTQKASSFPDFHDLPGRSLEQGETQFIFAAYCNVVLFC
jgi:hypothetical protein